MLLLLLLPVVHVHQGQILVDLMHHTVAVAALLSARKKVVANEVTARQHEQMDQCGDQNHNGRDQKKQKGVEVDVLRVEHFGHHTAAGDKDASRRFAHHHGLCV